MYDGSLGTIRFVHGDGTYAIPEDVCFMDSFRGGNPETGPRQRLHFMELHERATKYYQVSRTAEPFALAVYRGRFTTTAEVKRSLTYYSDLDSHPINECPALTQIRLHDNYEQVPDDDYSNTLAIPCVPLSSRPKWNFDPRLDFQPAVSGATGQEFKVKFEQFKEQYANWSLLWNEFQHAAFCLVGLHKAGLISVPNTAQDKHIKSEDTVRSWSVDCFIARHRKFLAFINHMNFAQCPHPIYWLEAELEDEQRLQRNGLGFRLMIPWKGTVRGNSIAPVVDWDTLQSLEWKESTTNYPREFSLPVSLVYHLWRLCC